MSAEKGFDCSERRRVSEDYLRPESADSAANLGNMVIILEITGYIEDVLPLLSFWSPVEVLNVAPEENHALM